METRRAIGAILMFAGAVLITAHLAAMADLIQSGTDPDSYVESGGSAIASTYAVPMGAAAIGIGAILLVSGLRKDDDEEQPAGSNWRMPSPRRMASAGVMILGISLLVFHVGLLYSLTAHVEAIERQPGFVPEGPAFQEERAKTQGDLLRINTLGYVGIALSMAGLLLGMNDSPRRKPEESAS